MRYTWYKWTFWSSAKIEFKTNVKENIKKSNFVFIFDFIYCSLKNNTQTYCKYKLIEKDLEIIINGNNAIDNS